MLKQKLTLNKTTVQKLNRQEKSSVLGGAGAWGECDVTNGCDHNTGGCTDSSWCLSMLNCTSGHCSANCTNNTGNTEMQKEVTSGA